MTVSTNRRQGLILLFILASLITLPLVLLVIVGLLDILGLLDPDFPMILDGKDGILFLVLTAVTIRFFLGWIGLLRRVREGGHSGQRDQGTNGVPPNL